MFYEIKAQAVYINVKVKPNAKESKLLNISENFLFISIKAQPVNDKANLELINFLSDYFGIAKREVEIVRGEKARLKRVKLPLCVVDRLNEISYE